LHGRCAIWKILSILHILFISCWIVRQFIKEMVSECNGDSFIKGETLMIQIRLFALAVIAVSAGLFYDNWQQTAGGSYYPKTAVMALIGVVGGLQMGAPPPSRADSRRRSLSVNERRPRGLACEGAGAPTSTGWLK
jgi:hypothetical protein